MFFWILTNLFLGISLHTSGVNRAKDVYWELKDNFSSNDMTIGKITVFKHFYWLRAIINMVYILKNY